MKTKNTLMILGGLLAAVTSLIPMATYADNTGNADVTVSVQPSISLDAATGTGDVAAVAGKVVDSSITATVTSNQAYTIAISAAEPRLLNAAITNPTVNEVIPSVSNLADGVNGWGIKKKVTNTDTDQANYSEVTTSASNIFYSSNAGAVGKQTTFTVGIGTSATLPSGTYQTEVTITAATTQTN